MSNLVCGLAFGTPNFYIVLYGKMNHKLVNLSYNSAVMWLKSPISVTVTTQINKSVIYFIIRCKVKSGCTECYPNVVKYWDT